MNEIARQNSFINFFLEIFHGLSDEEKIDLFEKIKTILEVCKPLKISNELAIGSGGFMETYHATFLDKKSNKVGFGFTKEKAINSLLSQDC